MTSYDLQRQIRIVSLTASEAVEEPDTIARRPEIVGVLSELSESGALSELFAKGNGHIDAVDPSAYVAALSGALTPYQHKPIDDAPDLIEELALLASVLQAGASATAA